MTITDQGVRPGRFDVDHPHYRWVVLSNTTLAMFLVTINASIVLISLPAIFRGIGLDPLAAGNASYLLWMLMGFLLVSAVLVVTFGRLGDIYGRVRIYNLGFMVFAAASVAVSLDPLTGSKGALWLIAWRVVQGVGGAMLFANAAAILTDAFPEEQRGLALGINQVAAIGGSFLGLLIGGLLAQWSWRAVFWVSVPIALIGMGWSYKSLREVGERHLAKLDWLGNVTFAVGLGIFLAGITYSIEPYGGHVMGWTNPWVIAALVGGVLLLVLFCIVENRVAEPMFNMGLFRIRAFSAANLAGLLASIGRGGMQFMLIIWLQGIWLPLHGYSFEVTPLWAGIYLLPLTIGFLVAGPASGYLSDRYGGRRFAVGGLLVVAAAFIGMTLLPVNFPYPVFALLVFVSGLGSGLFSPPNTTTVMNSVPKRQRGSASGMRGTFFNAGTALSIGIFFTLMVAGLAANLPASLSAGLTAQGVPAPLAHQVASLPPVGSLFAAFLGVNPVAALLGPSGVLHTLPAANVHTLTGAHFFPGLLSQPFHDGLVVVFGVAAFMMIVGAVASFIVGPSKVAQVSDVEAGERLGEEPEEADEREAEEAFESTGPAANPVPDASPAHHVVNVESVAGGER